MSELFSVPYFEQNFKEHIKQNEGQVPKLDAMNRYYRSVVSALVQDQLTKNSVVLKRIQNLDEAYNTIKSEK
ncbi:protein YvfG [Bacillus sp. V2I10]|jgi:GTP1/Obg family GTP-binding protein|uniref:protein YvfG n=1 Tax=Bacillus sp. V2I10 TaxID=3042276 RepID=UPI0020799704|nr:protein YvfG [Bacillus sp. V2I10]MDQ0857329.1 GTP1/Obg family GTP-binding protein [Bacillus sp. V2I10]USK33540.1 protein YvfG [Bacillus sp. F19]